MITIGSNSCGEKCYRVYLATGTAWYKVFQVYAYNESEAVDLVADYCVENELEGLYADYWDIYDNLEFDETVDNVIEANNLICCGNYGIYLEVAGLEEICQSIK